MVSKCRAVAEIAVMEVDVRRSNTRPPPDHLDALSSPSSNKRKLAAGPDTFDFSSTTTAAATSFVNLQTRRRRLLPENSVISTPLMEERTAASPTSDDIGSTSAGFCCSSNNCSEVVAETLEFVDLENEKDEHGVVRRERRESTPSSEFRSTQAGAVKREATSGNRSAKMPEESDLEEFFNAAEKNIQKRFVDKYNYDIVEDVPSEGRFEWIRLNP